MRAMIMAAGLGTRLWPLTGLAPKPMAPVLNRPALYHILMLLRRHGIKEVVINLHYFPETVTSYFGDGTELGMDVTYSVEGKLLGTAGGVKNNEAFLGEGTFLVLSGDALTDVDLTSLVTAHHTAGGLATLAVKEVADPSQYGVVVTGSGGRVTGFQEKPTAGSAHGRTCNCGIYVLEPTVLDRIPPGTFYDFGRQLLPEMVGAREAICAHRIREYWNDIGSLGEYRRANFDALAGLVRIEMPGRLRAPGVWVGERTVLASDVRIIGPVLVGDDCRVGEDVVLTGPLVIGDGSVIERGSRLESDICWSGTFVGDGCRVADSVIARGTHLAGMVQAEGSVMGERCLVGRGCRIRTRLLEPHATAWGREVAGVGI
jgi:NDP-sugar pyrophosphorylase family protein